MTQRNEHFFEYDWKNWTFWIRLKELNILNTTQRIEPIFKKKVIELNLFNMIQRIEPSFLHDTKSWTFLPVRLKEFNFFEHDYRIELFWNVTPRIEPFFFNMTQRVEFDSRIELFSNMTQRIEHFFECDSKNWTLFTKGLKEFFKKRLKELNLLEDFRLQEWKLFCDSGDGTFFSIGIKELSVFSTITPK